MAVSATALGVDGPWEFCKNTIDECYFMMLTALLYKHKISLLGIVFCLNPSQRLEGLFSKFLLWMSDESYSNVVIACTDANLVEVFQIGPIFPGLSTKLSKGWRVVNLARGRTSAMDIIMDLLRAEELFTFQTKLVDENVPLSAVGQWETLVSADANQLWNPFGYWTQSRDYVRTMDGATTRLLGQHMSVLEDFAQLMAIEARNADEQTPSKNAFKSVTATVMHFNDLLAARRAVQNRGVGHLQNSLESALQSPSPSALDSAQSASTQRPPTTTTSCTLGVSPSDPAIIAAESHTSSDLIRKPVQETYV
jgi:hypothetical protein